jgi:membrane-associated protease RseP (regulator of RpoE activity)
MAKYHKIKTSLPYFIPMPFMFIGTMGAVIRMKGNKQTKKQFFDVGIAGPLAGFVVALAFLIYGFTTIPPQEDITRIHPEYQESIDQYGIEHYQEHVYENLDENSLIIGIGGNLLFTFLENIFIENPKDAPGVFEVMHYPFIFAGYLALFFTALNLLPIGQLDGGHILYGLVGHKLHSIISPIIFGCFVFYAGLGFDYISILEMPTNDLLINSALYVFFMYLLFKNIVPTKINALFIAVGMFTVHFILNFVFPQLEGYFGWLFFIFMLSKVLGVFHPKAYIEEKISTNRKLLGWLSLVIFVLCFSPQPFIFTP